jgi:hypothetical protein
VRVGLEERDQSPPWREVIAVAVRWHLRHGHVAIYRWVQTFASEFIAAR